MNPQHQYYPSREELLAILCDTGESQEYYDSFNSLADEESEEVFARTLGYDPERDK